MHKIYSAVHISAINNATVKHTVVIYSSVEISMNNMQGKGIRHKAATEREDRSFLCT